MEGIKSLFKSRKFVISVASALLQLGVGLLANDPTIWRTLLPTLAATFASLVLSIAYEDANLVTPSDLNQPQ